jgi:hypothetical protein
MLVGFSSCDQSTPTKNRMSGTWGLSTISGEPIGAAESWEIEFSGSNFISIGGDSSALSGTINGEWRWIDQDQDLELSWRNDSSFVFLGNFELRDDEFSAYPRFPGEEFLFIKK